MGVERDTPAQEPLQQLVAKLAAAFDEEKQAGFVIDNDQPEVSFTRLDCRVRQLLKEYIQSGTDDWRKFVHWNPHHYVRNLVDIVEDDFELMVICWDVGQVSRIHDHHKAHGWVTVLDGAVEEKRFRVAQGKLHRFDSWPSGSLPPLPGLTGALTPCPKLEQVGAGVAKRGDGTIYINDHIALHSVGCASEENPAVTLHLYAPPVRRVQLFEPEEDRVLERKPGFYSIRGERV